MSGVGKGIASASISKILQSRGLEVTALKIDPYVNVDAGTMNPTEHGEVFVLNDGTECDQDMGNYERFLNRDLSKTNYMTTGSVYLSVIEKERNLEFGGKQVEVVPRIPLEIIERINKAAEKAKANIAITEIGGTVGEYENILFLEAVRMLKIKNPADVLLVLVSYVPALGGGGNELKTKPTQHAVRSLNSVGLHPDIILARAHIPLDEKRKEKIEFMCSLEPGDVISAPNVDNVYEVPLNFENDGLGDRILNKLKIKGRGRDMQEWRSMIKKMKGVKEELNIAIIGKYFETGDYVLSDSYVSVIEAIKYSAYAQNRKPVLSWLNSVDFEKNSKKLEELKKYDGIIVPGGYGSRGVEGKLKVAEFARKNKIPYFGLCYGMQMMVIEYARNVLGKKDANTREVNPSSKNIVIDVMEAQKELLEKKKYGGTNRLGAYKAVLTKGSIAEAAYRKKEISERHRHRYEVNNDYINELEENGLVFSGRSPDGKLMEIAELPKSVHPFYLGTQFHPEFLARPLHPHPLFTAFVKACMGKR